MKDKILSLFSRLTTSQIRWIGVTVFFICIISFFTSLTTTRYHHEETLCLALNIYHEGRGEPKLGKYAIATVTLNRVASSNYPDSVCKVVYQRSYNQKLKRYFGGFSWTQDNIDDMPMEQIAWTDAYNIAKETYQGEQHAEELSDALFYHADHIKPYWIKKKPPIKTIGKHVFYN
ncbi:MAG: cell wall hydrolase [Gammaproteobacteria bacterium]|nr:cell wall hydrolase [Gammaproteobacteria bacterium]